MKRIEWIKGSRRIRLRVEVSRVNRDGSYSYLCTRDATAAEVRAAALAVKRRNPRRKRTGLTEEDLDTIAAALPKSGFAKGD